METLYRKVAVSERKPKRGGTFYMLHEVDKWKSTGYIDRKGKFFNDWDEDNIECFPSHWLEEIPDPNAQLQADKAELLEALENSRKAIEWYMENTMPENENHTDFFNIGMNQRTEIESLIQKHKQ